MADGSSASSADHVTRFYEENPLGWCTPRSADDIVNGDDEPLLTPSLPNIDPDEEYKIFYQTSNGLVPRHSHGMSTPDLHVEVLRDLPDECSQAISHEDRSNNGHYQLEPPPRIFSALASYKKNKWSRTEINNLIIGVNAHGLKWYKMKNDPKLQQLNTRSNVDLKDKWRNIIYADVRTQFSDPRLNTLFGPRHWVSLIPYVIRAMNKHCRHSRGRVMWEKSDWKMISSDKEFGSISKLGEIHALTIYRCHLNSLKSIAKE